MYWLVTYWERGKSHEERLEGTDWHAVLTAFREEHPDAKIGRVRGPYW